MNQEQITQWIDQLKQQAQKSMLDGKVDHSFAIMTLVGDLDRWLKGGMQGTIPIGVQQLEPLGLAMPSPAAPPAPTEPPPTYDAQAGAANRTVRLSMEPVPSEPPSPEMQRLFDAGVAALRDSQFSQAKRQLSEVVKQAQGELLKNAQIALAQAQQQQIQLEGQVIAEAQQIDRQDPNNFARRRDAWRKVVERSEAEGENYKTAQLKIREIEQFIEGRGTAEALVKLRQDINLAIQGKQLTALANCVASIEDLRARERNPTLTEELAILLGETSANQRNLRTELGIASTLSISGDYEKAYEEARKVVDAGTQETWDARDGKVSPASVLLVEFATALIEFRKGKATERMQLAERDLKNGNPHRGLALYTEALAFLTHLTLKTEERDKIVYVIGGEGNLPKVQGRDLVATERAEIEEGLREAQTLRDRWNDGFKLTQEAGQATDPRRAIGLLRDAQALFNQPPPLTFTGLDETIRRRQADLAAELTAQVQSDCANAEAELNRNNFASALTHVNATRSKAVEIQQLTGNGDLTTRVGTLTKEIRKREQRAAEVKAILDAVSAQLNGSVPDPKQASVLLNRLEGDEWSPTAIQLKIQIATMQGADENWLAIQQAYADEQWQNVVNISNQLVKTTYKQDAEKYSGRAAAMLAFLRAKKHQSVSPRRITEERQCYTEITTKLGTYGVDDQTQIALQVAQEQITLIDELAKSNATISPTLKEARQLFERTQVMATQDAEQTNAPLQLRPGWKEAYDTITPLLPMPSTLTAEIQGLQYEICTAWRADYLGRIRKITRSISDLGNLFKLGDELLKANLLLDSSDLRLVREIELDYRVVQVKAQYSINRPNWQRIEEHEQRILELVSLGYQPSEQPAEAEAWLVKLGYQPAEAGAWSEEQCQQRIALARMNRFRSEAQILWRDGNIKGAAESKLKEALASPDLGNNADLIIELIKLYLETKNFEEAHRYARKLTVSGLWVGLTRAMELFEQKKYNEAIIQVEHISQTITGGENQAREWLEKAIATAVEALIRKAQETSVILDAVQSYSLAQQLLDKTKETRRDIRVTSGLENLSSAVVKEIDIVCESVGQLKLTANPKNGIADATSLRDRLQAIQIVQEQLTLDPRKRRIIDQTLQDLTTKLTGWEEALRSLERAEKSCEEARRETWDFAHARQLVQAVSREPDFRSQAQILISKISAYEAWVKRLQSILDTLDSAIRGEQFDQTIAACNELDREWSQMGGELDHSLEVEGLKNQKKMKFHYYTIQRMGTNQDEHRTIAVGLKENYELWRVYAADLLRIEAQVKKAFTKAEQDLNEQLESLDKLITEFTTCRDDCDKLAELLQAEKPKPQSMLATTEQQRAAQVHTRRSEHKQWRDRSDTYLQECAKKREQLKVLLGEINRHLDNPRFASTRPNNDMIEGIINEAVAIDPVDGDLQKAQAALAKRRKSELPPRRRWW